MRSLLGIIGRWLAAWDRGGGPENGLLAEADCLTCEATERRLRLLLDFLEEDSLLDQETDPRLREERARAEADLRARLKP